ncbi:GNAT family N-acetyltransferase [Catenuloplanes atrovinosus]|uniref:GNAT superfamily N-acetyltransferase n=1 Tax=Catenuloplanes atrovinosus TaxID=137266 RepID=A0AAE3YS75_9ACTN|nr:GNAT family N-acetyltransferase [Catenuloplanes atrovinosus]MDR7278675.1 GNAT superfamily N-acetyltransferase [Catenuloplanes atrovinosus]
MSSLLDHVARGGRLPPEPFLEIVPAPSARDFAVLSFPARVVIAAPVTLDWVNAHLPDTGDEFSEPMNPPFLHALERHLGRRVNNIDQLLVASALPGPPPVPLAEIQDHTHPRVRHAVGYRDHVHVYAATGGLLTVGRGLAGRWELSMEVDPAHRDAGLGRALVTAARHLIPPDAHVWAQVAPGNAASTRALLAAGFTPAGAEAILQTPLVAAPGTS